MWRPINLCPPSIDFPHRRVLKSISSIYWRILDRQRLHKRSDFGGDYEGWLWLALVARVQPSPSFVMIFGFMWIFVAPTTSVRSVMSTLRVYTLVGVAAHGGIGVVFFSAKNKSWKSDKKSCSWQARAFHRSRQNNDVIQSNPLGRSVVSATEQTDKQRHARHDWDARRVYRQISTDVCDWHVMLTSSQIDEFQKIPKWWDTKRRAVAPFYLFDALYSFDGLGAWFEMPITR